MVIAQGIELSQSPLSCQPPVFSPGTCWFHFPFSLLGEKWTFTVLSLVSGVLMCSFILYKHLLTDPHSPRIAPGTMSGDTWLAKGFWGPYKWLGCTFGHSWPSAGKHGLHPKQCIQTVHKMFKLQTQLLTRWAPYLRKGSSCQYNISHYHQHWAWKGLFFKAVSAKHQLVVRENS